jgi:hypothetical protein
MFFTVYFRRHPLVALIIDVNIKIHLYELIIEEVLCNMEFFLSAENV